VEGEGGGKGEVHPPGRKKGTTEKVINLFTSSERKEGKEKRGREKRSACSG